jgi:hypothetical protein
MGSGTKASGSGQVARWNSGVYDVTAAITSFTMTAGSNFDDGVIYIYGSVA